MRPHARCNCVYVRPSDSASVIATNPTGRRSPGGAVGRPARMRPWHTCLSNLGHLSHNLAHMSHLQRLTMATHTPTSRTGGPRNGGTYMYDANTTSPRPPTRRLAWLAVAAITGMLAVASSTAAAGASDDGLKPQTRLTTPQLVANGALSMSALYKSFDSDATFLVQTTGEVSWHHTVGTQRFTYSSGETLTRRVEAWITPDGRYRVKTTSLDGTHASTQQGSSRQIHTSEGPAPWWLSAFGGPTWAITAASLRHGAVIPSLSTYLT